MAEIINIKDICTLPTPVRIRAFGLEVFYMRDLPLHHSQTEVLTEEGYSDFELKIRPSADFFTFLELGPHLGTSSLYFCTVQQVEVIV